MTINKELFTDEQLKILREKYRDLKRIDPNSRDYANLIAILDSLSQAQLKQFRDANIKFVSRLARNRIKE